MVNFPEGVKIFVQEMFGNDRNSTDEFIVGLQILNASLLFAFS